MMKKKFAKLLGLMNKNYKILSVPMLSEKSHLSSNRKIQATLKKTFLLSLSDKINCPIIQ